MYTALYRAYRPEVFDEILGQDHIVRILKNQIQTDTTSHAYLFAELAVQARRRQRVSWRKV